MERIKLYTFIDLETMLKEANLVIDRVYGEYNGKQYNEKNSTRMIVVGHRD